MQNLVEIGPAILEKKIFEKLSMYFRYFVIITPWKRDGPFINLNPLFLRILCGKFGLNWPSGSGEEDENGKSLRQRPRQLQQRQQRTHFDQKSSLEPSALIRVRRTKYVNSSYVETC